MSNKNSKLKTTKLTTKNSPIVFYLRKKKAANFLKNVSFFVKKTQIIKKGPYGYERACRTRRRLGRWVWRCVGAYVPASLFWGVRAGGVKKKKLLNSF